MAVLDVPTLRRALEATGVNAHRIPQTITRLMRPPLSLHFSASDNAGHRLGLPFEPDEEARMFCPKSWKDLTRNERKRVRQTSRTASIFLRKVVLPLLILHSCS